MKIETGIDEGQQESSFMNATLQDAGKNTGLAMSISTTMDIPDHIAAQGEERIAAYISFTLKQFESHGLKFHVQLGPARDTMQDAKKLLAYYEGAKKEFMVKVALGNGFTDGYASVSVRSLKEAAAHGSPMAIQNPDGDWVDC